MIVKNRLSAARGLSLMEIVIVMGLAVILLMAVYGSFVISHKAFSTSDKRLELVQNGRVVLDRLSRELRQAMEIVTALPATKNEVGFPPANEILFQDGHVTLNIQYLRYYLAEGTLKRQRIVYFFSSEPGTYVYWNAQDEFGSPPGSQILEEKDIGEYINQILF